jgi:tryptophan synthase alpha subunit
MQVSVDGVTGPRANVNPRVESLLKEIKEVRFADFLN